MNGETLLLGVANVWLQPLWIVGTVAAVVLVVLLIFTTTVRMVAPRVAAIAKVTAREAMSQPLFYVILSLGIVALVLFLFIPYNTFGEDLKMVKAEGLTLIKILAVVLAVWTASVSISEEIEGRTALMILSKPIGRRQFVFGKFLGVLLPVALMFIILGAVFLASISYKVVYDAREAAQEVPSATACAHEVVKTIPGLALSFMEAALLASVSVAISTRLSMMANLTICATIYVLGHLVPLMVQSSIGEIAFVRFVGSLSAAVLPVLDTFNVEGAISTGTLVPWPYLALTAVYCVLYCTVAMLLALLFFEDRDLA